MLVAVAGWAPAMGTWVVQAQSPLTMVANRWTGAEHPWPAARFRTPGNSSATWDTMVLADLHTVTGPPTRVVVATCSLRRL